MSAPTILSPIVLLSTVAAHARSGLTQGTVHAAQLEGNSAIVHPLKGSRLVLSQPYWRHATAEEASTLNRTEPSPTNGEDELPVWDEDAQLFVDGNGDPLDPQPTALDPAFPAQPLERTPDGSQILVPSTDGTPHVEPLTDESIEDTTNDEAVAEAEAQQAGERAEFEAQQGDPDDTNTEEE